MSRRFPVVAALIPMVACGLCSLCAGGPTVDMNLTDATPSVPPTVQPLDIPSPDYPLPTEMPWQEGMAPDFTLPTLDGRTVTLSELRGQVVVLDFWASWCGPCQESMPALQALHERYAGRGVTVLAINEEENRSTVEAYVAGRYTFTVLLDEEGSVGTAYGVWGIPHTVVVDRDGWPHVVWEGPEGTEAEVVRLLSMS